MKKLQFTDHFLLTNQIVRLTKINFIQRLHLTGVVFVAFFLIIPFCPLYAEVKLALIDTGFCVDRVYKNSKIIIDPAIDLTSTTNFDCQRFDPKNPRFHGQLVLEEFLKFYDNKNLVLHIYPLIVFNQHGDQKKDYWLKALDWIKKNKIDFVLTASGLITNEKLVSSLTSLWFVPSGRVTPQIKEQSELFPQNLAPIENMFLIGDYYQGKQILYDQGLLYKDKIDYYFPSGSKDFKGTSRAVAEAAARALNLCPISNMRACLKKLSKEYVDNLSHSKIQTY